jgi:small GTP-binding protein
MKSKNPYQPGGTLAGASYIERSADQRLQRAIADNQLYPFFLAARQSGKSSVLARAKSLLNSPQLHIAIVDLSEFSPDALTLYERFISEFVYELLEQIHVEPRLQQVIKDLAGRPRFLLQAFRAVLARVSGRLIVCIDEVDVLTRCPFKDEFLSQVRALFNRRTTEETLRRVQFVLAGAAACETLITDVRRSPFNVGEDINLDDLTFKGVRQLALLGWPECRDSIEEVVNLLLFWTGGSAYLCQFILHRAFQQCAETQSGKALALEIERTVSKTIGEAGRIAHFANIARLLKSNAPLLKRWRDWNVGDIPDDITIGELTIIGISGRDAPFRNKLYQSVFGHRGPLSLLHQDSSEFGYDVFLSHSAKDKPVVHELAERLRSSGLKVWYDEWEIKPGHDIPAEIEKGLEQSQTMVLCMSKSGFASEWVNFERQTALFRDPTNSNRRFIPVRLDGSALPSVLQRFNYIDWRHKSDREFERLIAACRGQIPMAKRTTNAGNIVEYAGAKVVLIGDSGVGKTGLAMRLASAAWRPSAATAGVSTIQWKLPVPEDDELEREVWLWDFGGQEDYRLIHQLYMDDTDVAVLIFDAQRGDAFDAVRKWDRYLARNMKKPFSKLLVAARVDTGGLRVSRNRIETFAQEHGFAAFLETSAKSGLGCEELRKTILNTICWDEIPRRVSPMVFKNLRDEIIKLKDERRVLIRFNELRQTLQLKLLGASGRFTDEELEAVLNLLAGSGLIQRLDFGGFILLQPEVLYFYASALLQKVREHPHELGCIREEQLLAGDLDYLNFERLQREEEAVVLRALLETFISRAWCLRQSCDGSGLLTFPSYFRRERKEQPSHPSVLVTYRFDGPADDIYATLVVRLHHTLAFQSTNLWKSAADFRTQTGQKLGFALTRESESNSLLEIYFEPDVDENSRVLFLRYVHDHLMQHAQKVSRLRRYFCVNQKCVAFGEAFGSQILIDRAVAIGKANIFCPVCASPIPLHDGIEKKFESPAVKDQVREMQRTGQAMLDNESRELILVGHMFAIVAEAGQIFRSNTNLDYGIDGEIEFRDDQGRASGKRLYVQLKSGDHYLKKRERDGAEVFQIKNPHWADYWQQQAYAVMLVIRTSDGEIRWMDVSAYLKRESATGKAVKQIFFAGERFDAVSLQNWRKKILRS